VTIFDKKPLKSFFDCQMYSAYLKRIDLMLTVALLLTVIWIWDKSSLVPAIFLAAYSLIAFHFIHERIKIRSSFGVLVPPGKGRIKVLIIRLAVVMQGVILLTSGAVETAPFLEFKGVDIKVFVGIFLMMAGLMRNKRYMFLLTAHTITFNDQKGWSEWKINEISSFSVRRNKIIFHKSNTSREIIFPDSGGDYPALISKKLKQIWELNPAVDQTTIG
jgi:hypothetical protein